MGGALALDAAWLFAAFLIIGVLAAAGVAFRRHLLERGGGTVECGLRHQNGSWRLGVASYQREELVWFGVFGLTVRPDEVFPRRDLAVVSRRLPSNDEAGTLGPNMIVIECALGADTPASASTAVPHTDPADPADPAGPAGPSTPTGPSSLPSLSSAPSIVELAMGEAALTGFLSWLEASPPSSHLGIALLQDGPPRTLGP